MMLSTDEQMELRNHPVEIYYRSRQRELMLRAVFFVAGVLAGVASIGLR